MNNNFSLSAVIRSIAPPAPAPTLGLGDFEHASKNLDYLLAYLREIVRSGRAGVNIFIHGQPGTGKSELVRLVAKVLKCQLHEVGFEDDERDAVDGEGRLKALRAAQMMIGRQRSLLVFDEAEDVFGQESLLRRSLAQSRKAWINRMLETNPVPTFWISNSLDGLDRAFARRFDLKLEFNYISARQAHALLQSHCLDLGIASPLPADLEQVANLGNLTPGDFANVARQHRFRKFTGASGFVGALATECATKDKQHVRKVGFA